MRKRLVRKTFDMIQELSEREDKEVKFIFYNFGNIVCITFCWTDPNLSSVSLFTANLISPYSALLGL